MTYIGRRCGMGCTTWPDAPEFLNCAICREPTKRYRGVDPLSDKEAKSVKNHGDFEHYYETVHVKDTTPITDSELADMGIVLISPQDIP